LRATPVAQFTREWEVFVAAQVGAQSEPLASKPPNGRSAAAKVEAALAEYRDQISSALREQFARLRPHEDEEDAGTRSLLDTFYGQMEYHFGWRDALLAPAFTNPGKLLRPALVLMCARLLADDQKRAATSATVTRAIPAALAVEMVHNFSLIHDDIEDGDEVRRHRATLWRVWGQPQAINTGDGLFTLARASLLDLLTQGVPAETVTRLAALLDRTCLRLCEGQHLDMSFEGHLDVTPTMYLAMIRRKTAALMACATEMGAWLGGADELDAQRMAEFGEALGMGFQLRDDLLGIWASDEQLGKRAAGDLRRKKMSLPVIYALEHASPTDRQILAELYGAEAALDDAQIDLALGVLERAQAQHHVRGLVREHCRRAREELDGVTTAAARSEQARVALFALVDFIEVDVL
jgi:geranylgeranyl diphosphate synthase type I